MPFNILIDYDNLDRRDRSQSLIYLTDKILRLLSPTEVNDKNIDIRLYGGWYENNNITRKAQNLNT